jgi:Helicase associated domain
LDRVRRLEQIGFEWSPYDLSWERQFRALVEYKERLGNCDVPAKWPTNNALANWTGTQRSLMKAGRLSKERIERLNRVGFVWHRLNHSWEAMLTALGKHKGTYGNLEVSPKENPALSRWMDRQRQAKRRGKLSRERTLQLDRLGFVWDALADRWGERFAELVAYKRVHGECQLPTTRPR